MAWDRRGCPGWVLFFFYRLFIVLDAHRAVAFCFVAVILITLITLITFALAATVSRILVFFSLRLVCLYILTLHFIWLTTFSGFLFGLHFLSVFFETFAGVDFTSFTTRPTSIWCPHRFIFVKITNFSFHLGVYQGSRTIKSINLGVNVTNSMLRLVVSAL